MLVQLSWYCFSLPLPLDYVYGVAFGDVLFSFRGFQRVKFLKRTSLLIVLIAMGHSDGSPRARSVRSKVKKGQLFSMSGRMITTATIATTIHCRLLT